jgi:hypothetical protein
MGLEVGVRSKVRHMMIRSYQCLRALLKIIFVGANPALYSRKLMHYASLELERFDDIANNEYDIDEYYNVDPKDILQKSYDAVQQDAAKEGLVGSTTALLVILRVRRC